MVKLPTFPERSDATDSVTIQVYSLEWSAQNQSSVFVRSVCYHEILGSRLYLEDFPFGRKVTCMLKDLGRHSACLGLGSLSREIGFPHRARIIEFGSKEKGGKATISCGRFLNPKSAGFLPTPIIDRLSRILNQTLMSCQAHTICGFIPSPIFSTPRILPNGREARRSPRTYGGLARRRWKSILAHLPGAKEWRPHSALSEFES
jgi:hypothetical protein